MQGLASSEEGCPGMNGAGDSSELEDQKQEGLEVVKELNRKMVDTYHPKTRI